ncbi:MAG: hypothetical protein ACRCUB_05725 [Plesiomonas shigelloides]|uniref:hypothetical protein n=1 Tax=Clostridium sp. TaxID=1506 RepID=UPI003EE7D569
MITYEMYKAFMEVSKDTVYPFNKLHYEKLCEVNLAYCTPDNGYAALHNELCNTIDVKYPHYALRYAMDCNMEHPYRPMFEEFMRNKVPLLSAGVTMFSPCYSNLFCIAMTIGYDNELMDIGDKPVPIINCSIAHYERLLRMDLVTIVVIGGVEQIALTLNGYIVKTIMQLR